MYAIGKMLSIRIGYKEGKGMAEYKQYERLG
jgi:hypothetical protein